MSFNASKLFGNTSALRTRINERELDQEVASATLADGRHEARYAQRNSFIAWHGLVALDKAANAAFGEGHQLPWNLIMGGKEWEKFRARERDGKGSRGYVAKDLSEERIQKTARLVGWLKSAAKFRSLRKAIKASTSPRGMNSLGTHVNLWEVARKRPSPGQMARALEAVKERADALVSAFRPGCRASWRSLMLAVVFGPRQTCKAAVMAAAMTLLPKETIRLYRDGRNALAALASAKVVDTSDGVDGRRSDTPVLSKNGVEVYTLYTSFRKQRGNVRFGFEVISLVRRKADGRTYHEDSLSAEYAAKEAIAAWRSQDNADRIARRDVHLQNSYLKGDFGFCPIFFRKDSHSVGHCAAGTDAWMGIQGWGNRDIIFGWELLPHLGDSRIRRIISQRMQYDVSYDALLAAA